MENRKGEAHIYRTLWCVYTLAPVCAWYHAHTGASVYTHQSVRYICASPFLFSILSIFNVIKILDKYVFILQPTVLCT